MAKTTNVNLIRNVIIGAALLLIAAIAIYGTLYSSGATVGEFAEGEHYALIDDAKPRRPGSPVVITEYFSYGCIHCKNFDPLIEEWLPSLPDGVRFERAPVSFSPAWGLLAQAYLTLERLDALDGNHERLFRAIHDNGRQFLSADQLADFAARGGVDKQEFLRTFNSSAVKRRLSAIETDMVAHRVSSVPNIVVAGKYRINNNVGRKLSLSVVDHLIAQELGNKPTGAPD